jgi:hypothetical protein
VDELEIVRLLASNLEQAVARPLECETGVSVAVCHRGITVMLTVEEDVDLVPETWPTVAVGPSIRICTGSSACPVRSSALQNETPQPRGGTAVGTRDGLGVGTTGALATTIRSLELTSRSAAVLVGRRRSPSQWIGLPPRHLEVL